ncbi:MAG: ABC transporter ATP-binding protein [Lentisphaerae bacterium GWF2_45_14]|nr:MAG: ABC transporter ATP-binding protein [Lentisphaerae bacterium GWF2_45_14]
MSNVFSPLPADVPSIRVTDIKRSYVSGKITNNVLKGNTFDLYPGKLTLIMGPSGSGKSTLLSVISGLLKPDNGRVEINGINLWNLSFRKIEKFRLDHFGFIFQGFNLFDSLTAREQILVLLKYLHSSEKEAYAIADEVLDEVGLSKVKHLRPAQLSGGEKQRVAIARALAKKPAFLFADEPTSALDKENGQIVISLLHKAAKIHNATIFAVSHDPRLLPHADRVITIEDGTITRDQNGGVQQ